MSNSLPWRRVPGHLADLLLPQDCFVCGAPARAEALCPACRDELPAQGPSVCPCCALPSPSGALCGECQCSPPDFDATHALYRYAFPVDRMVQGLKYHRRLALARFFAGRLVDGYPPFEADLLLPMPLHARRLAERGFNQAVEIARPLARAWRLPLDVNGVRRVRDLPAQAGLSRAARTANLRKAFACRRDLAGMRVLVVDDVMTTGASLRELARVLKAHGAARVENLVVARTP
ncbi:ComF family protein [Pseudothauera nasutitermitis]|uniref:ComF family protein n=1 Tax=Pseudothauera nasutitermitis TaxID=2565930 RepID=UPI001E5D4869|nr:ComF family protein [Pseudothauera nasutitermitis]